MLNLLRCRFCDAPLEHVFADLGMSPLSNSYVRPEQQQQMEPFYPLIVYVCGKCFLAQLPSFATPERIFGDYAYFSSYSETWLAHARAYCSEMIDRFALGSASRVVEIASNDGYLLQYFRGRGIPVLGIEPARNVAKAALDAGIETLVDFFGAALALDLVAKGMSADLLLGNNVLAHVPDLNDFVEGLRILLKPGAVITMEFPHLVRLIEGNQFDTIYHEHFSYFSLSTVVRVFEAHGLQIFDVQELSTHGGSLRIFAQHRDHRGHQDTPAVQALLAAEREFGVERFSTYERFAEKVRKTKRNLLHFLIDAKDRGKRVVGYGAPAKGNTLLNYCGVKTDLLEFTVDRNPYKQGTLLPGTRIPVHAPERITDARPDYLLILPWNIKDEITRQMQCVRDWGGRFVVPIPELRVLD